MIQDMPYHAVVYVEDYITAQVTLMSFDYLMFDEAHRWIAAMMREVAGAAAWEVKSNRRDKVLASGGDEWLIAAHQDQDTSYQPAS